jgi:hypothetical protein
MKKILISLETSLISLVIKLNNLLKIFLPGPKTVQIHSYLTFYTKIN